MGVRDSKSNGDAVLWEKVDVGARASFQGNRIAGPVVNTGAPVINAERRVVTPSWCWNR